MKLWKIGYLGARCPFSLFQVRCGESGMKVPGSFRRTSPSSFVVFVLFLTELLLAPASWLLAPDSWLLLPDSWLLTRLLSPDSCSCKTSSTSDPRGQTRGVFRSSRSNSRNLQMWLPLREEVNCDGRGTSQSHVRCQWDIIKVGLMEKTDHLFVLTFWFLSIEWMHAGWNVNEKWKILNRTRRLLSSTNFFTQSKTKK